MPYKHIPVMLNEVVHYMNCKPGNICVDCTLGGSGHSRAVLEKIMPDGLLIGIDQDINAIKNAQEILKPYASNIRLFHGNYANLPEFLSELDIHAVDGILLDLGISLDQLESSGRGFSFKRDEPLDMRMNVEWDIKAGDLVNGMEEQKLANVFREYGEERWAKRIARNIAKARKHKKISSSKELAQIVVDSVPAKASARQKIHPATRVFMALRIAVNKELENLTLFMKKIISKDNCAILNSKGRLCVLSFHSLEDRIVKHHIKAMEKGCDCPPEIPRCICNKKKVVQNLTRKVQRPSDREIAVNPMARSTKLRAAEKL
ncbi:MAG: 16S rRNA (cytosine(1402)-N(4))-methyltransferase RsmH [Desulfobacteraceae bacterium]|nr:16S rRNA (cytosine(1402)-N(4))-methyltransferase RsmH [Desulfobacteraceae bacterium]